MCLTMTCRSSPQDHNGNKGNHFLFHVSSWVVISKPWDFANFMILYMYFKCVFNILLHFFMLLICDTKINNKLFVWDISITWKCVHSIYLMLSLLVWFKQHW